MPLMILVAEDDEGTRLSINDYLEMQGYSVVTASHGAEALECIQTYQPHLLITDIAMPYMDGYELVRQVRQQPMLRLLPVVFLTAHNDTGDRIRGYQMGCDLYLPKPFELEELAAIVRNLLERTQMIQAAWLQQSSLEMRSDDASLTPNQRPKAMPDTIQLDLTAREREVLSLLSDGLSNAQIGDQLYLSSRTIEKYVSNLLRKTETNNRAELVRFAIDHHLVS
ncbi:DNA-binding response regulator [Halomicronema hongdechloris C2206]|uniref:DNA-binding response regulator n=1 Tax=Halomicronema hongdechloris C2206 TaxID=1641165 RepID=A0A1Z3HJM1_9CYAN|nr:response regulator transcription factor [Halomicronema hongdechloris]ASC70501.1 DNA-binding response regulator [Halomicronema hongdechloris C2206]